MKWDKEGFFIWANKQKKSRKEKIDTLATLKKNCRVGENIYNEITDKRVTSRI